MFMSIKKFKISYMPIISAIILLIIGLLLLIFPQTFFSFNSNNNQQATPAFAASVPHYFFSISTVAYAAMPSPRPV